MSALEDQPPPSSAASAPRDWFYPNHLGKLVVFGILGGPPFFIYWSYRNWRAYAANRGYSRRPFWTSVRMATGYRPSALWRALLLDVYLFCLFPAVDRECRTRSLRGVWVAELLAAAFAVLHFAQGLSTDWLLYVLLSPVWLVVPVQIAINRLHRAEGRALPLKTNAWEVGWVLLGAFGLWRSW